MDGSCLPCRLSRRCLCRRPSNRPGRTGNYTVRGAGSDTDSHEIDMKKLLVHIPLLVGCYVSLST